uniref:peptidylprolyl isomerase n=1 Tax=Cyclopterus lumpus TaxID=8103 RepID=A0A8C2XQK5_CYCLU
FTMKSCVFLLLLAAFTCGLAQGEDSEAEELQVETLVKPETCSVLSTTGDTLQIHYTGKLMDGKVIDSSLSLDPLVVELGKRTVIPGLEQSLIGVCVGQKIKATIPSHLFEVEVVSLTQQTSWQKKWSTTCSPLCLALVPTRCSAWWDFLPLQKSQRREAKQKEAVKSKIYLKDYRC